MENNQFAVAKTNNPFGQASKNESSALVEAKSQEAIQEVQAALVVAKRFPRDPIKCVDAILQACTRKGLAETALYSYSRGGAEITGASIRLAEVMAQNWGNMRIGVKELSQKNGVSEVEAFAWDLETNTYSNKIFQVSHTRHSKLKGNTLLTDPRDIYEKVANDGARRLRACILSVIPSDVQEAAVQQCDNTLRATADTSPENIKKIVAAFVAFGVTEEMIQKKLGNRLDAIRPAQVILLQKIYVGLRDGIGKVNTYFEIPEGKEIAATVDPTVDAINQQANELEDEPVDELPEPIKESIIAAFKKKKAKLKASDPELATLIENAIERNFTHITLEQATGMHKVLSETE